AKVPERAGYLVGGGSPLACLGPSSGVPGEVVGVLQNAAVELVAQQHPGQDPRRDLHRCDGAKTLAQLLQELGDGDIGLSVQRDRCFTSRGDWARGGGRTAGRVEVVGTHSGATPSVPARMDGESGTWLRGRSARGFRPPRNNTSSKSGLAFTMRIKADKLFLVVLFRPWEPKTGSVSEIVKVVRRSSTMNPSAGVHRVGEHIPGPAHQHPCPVRTQLPVRKNASPNRNLPRPRGRGQNHQAQEHRHLPAGKLRT